MSGGRGRRAVALVVVVTVGAAACGGGDDSSEGSGSGSGSGSQTAANRQIKGPGCEFIVAGEESRVIPPKDDMQFLMAAEASATECYDKITFFFDQGDGPDLPPGYTVEYREDPFGLEGIPTSTGGFKDARAVIYVEIPRASATDGRQTGRVVETYKGNLRLQLKGMEHTVIVEYLSKIVDPTPFENPDDAKIVWLIGLDEKRPFTVDTVNQPPRVSVLVMK